MMSESGTALSHVIGAGKAGVGRTWERYIYPCSGMESPGRLPRGGGDIWAEARVALSELEHGGKDTWQKASVSKGTEDPTALPWGSCVLGSAVQGRAGDTGLLGHLHLVLSIQSTCMGGRVSPLLTALSSCPPDILN